MNAYAQQIMCIVFSSVSLILSQFSVIPQLFVLKKTRNTSGISLTTYIIFMTTATFWFSWSYMFYYNQMIQGEPAGVTREMHIWGMIPTIIMNNLEFFVMIVILSTKVHHLNLCKKLKIDELELAKRLLAKDNQKYGTNVGKRYAVQIVILTIFLIIIGGVIAFIYLYATPDTSWPAIPRWIVIALNAMGAITWEAVNWPQFAKSFREKDTSGISLAWAIFIPVSCSFVFVSDLLQGLASGQFDFSVIFSLIFNGMISGYGVLTLKITNIKKAKKMGLTEKEYSEKILLPLVAKKKAQKADKKSLKQKKNK